MRESLIVVALGLMALSTRSAGQSVQRWTISAGPAIVYMVPNHGTAGNAAGGLLRTDVRIWRVGNLSVGVGAHAAVFVQTRGDRFCVSQTACSDGIDPHLQSFVSAGATMQLGSSSATGWSYYVRGFAEPLVGRIVQSPSAGPAQTFATSGVGLGFGLARGRFRTDLEAGLLLNVRRGNPTVVSLQLGLAPGRRPST